ncbi:hypothetical protein SAMN05660860_00809 [Geoalkalibacter ferrihydriticus]|uniref:Uncharacterized protein n=2 Tax=Geoalkalibacter ferrihydriticus TaxID=392333 RepID=A0A0C2HIE0_9BACT|nr:hypothetical protein [Geoalkalibacter ferrihydriticus]KIH76791.1 hypothetical protein GFER_06635 [Geoalkalibacter ferrihydriticus DSM 17813]SDL50854.1 hypothetical protein SAMN05660860_00809 [Geoalkalibacter ferrihydriticus]
MAFDAGIVLIWILFLALFPLAFFWLRRAWRIFVKRDYSEVALKRGESPPNPKKWAPATGILNLFAGAIALWIILGVPLWVATGISIGPFHEFDVWSAVAGSTIWIKIFADFIISRQAHPFTLGKKKKK